ncbi:MAG: hypothetical protein EOO81_05540, partial [Oxalobacteraceae bacterium]
NYHNFIQLLIPCSLVKKILPDRILIVWCGDTGAYFSGKSLGKHKLAPRMSPNKTWEGAVGGVISSIIGASVVAAIYGEGFLREYGSPDFVFYQKSIEKWDVPDDKENLTLIEKKQLIQFLKEEFPRRKMVLKIE